MAIIWNSDGSLNPRGETDYVSRYNEVLFKLGFKYRFEKISREEVIVGCEKHPLETWLRTCPDIIVVKYHEPLWKSMQLMSIFMKLDAELPKEPPPPEWAEVDHSCGIYFKDGFLRSRGARLFGMMESQPATHISANVAMFEAVERLYKFALKMAPIPTEFAKEDYNDLSQEARDICTSIRRRAEELRAGK